MQVRLFSVALVLIFVPAVALGQDITLSGRAYEPDYGPGADRLAQSLQERKGVRYKPVSGLLVLIAHPNSTIAVDSAYTDAEGRYSLVVKSGKYELRTDSISYMDFSKKLNLNGADLERDEDIYVKRRIIAAQLERNCTVPNYGDLTQRKQESLYKLGISESVWNLFSNRQRLTVFNILGAIDETGFSHEEIAVDFDPGKGVRLDRVYFKDTDTLFRQLISSQHLFSPDVGSGSAHAEYKRSYRRNRFAKSLQLSFTEDAAVCDKMNLAQDTKIDSCKDRIIKASSGPAVEGNSSLTADMKHNRVDADLDIFNPNWKGGFGIGVILHGLEVGLTHRFSKLWGWGGLTDPYSVSMNKNNWECLEQRKVR